MQGLKVLGVALALISGALSAQPVVDDYAQQWAHPEPGRCLQWPVNVQIAPGIERQASAEGVELRYRMLWNNIAEGWSWQPLADPEKTDYYRYKFLPLASLDELRGHYEAEDKIGEPQTMQVHWRYDYFLAFANPSDFYPRATDDDAGFAITVPSAPERVGMRAEACLIAPVVSESSTFYKATHAHPEDFTLKKRYLIGELKAIEFVDLERGVVLGRLVAKPVESTE